MTTEVSETQLETTVSVSESIDNFIEELKNDIKSSRDYITSLKAIKSQVKNLERENRKFSKSRKKPRKNSNNSGLQKLCYISDPLADLLGLDRGVMMSRTRTNKMVYKYLDDNGLKVDGKRCYDVESTEAGRKVKALLDLTAEKDIRDENKEPTGEKYNVYEKEGLTIYTFQTLLRPNYSKEPFGETSVETTSGETTSAETEAETGADTETESTKTKKVKKTTKKKAAKTKK